MHDTKRAGWALMLLVLAPLFCAQPAAAEIVAQSETGFVVRLVAEVTAPPAETWRTLTTPALWWSGQHTFSGDAANLTFDPVVGGCFCETLPRPDGAPVSQRLGGVQHMRVVYIEPPRAIRLTGALGPLQSEALSATMTMTVKPTDTAAGKGSRILFEYVVGGFMRYKVDEIAPAVDRMLAAQLISLAGKLGPVVEEAPPAKATALVADVPAAPVESRAVAPLRSAKTYSLPPARRTKPALAPQPACPAAKPPVQTSSVPAPEPISKAVPKPVQLLARPAVKPATKLAGKPSAKPAAKPAAKAPNPDDAAHTDANAAFDALLGASPAP